MGAVKTLRPVFPLAYQSVAEAEEAENLQVHCHAYLLESISAVTGRIRPKHEYIPNLLNLLNGNRTVNHSIHSSSSLPHHGSKAVRDPVDLLVSRLVGPVALLVARDQCAARHQGALAALGPRLTNPLLKPRLTIHNNHHPITRRRDITQSRHPTTNHHPRLVTNHLPLRAISPLLRQIISPLLHQVILLSLLLQEHNLPPFNLLRHSLPLFRWLLVNPNLHHNPLNHSNSHIHHNQLPRPVHNQQIQPRVLVSRRLIRWFRQPVNLFLNNHPVYQLQKR